MRPLVIFLLFLGLSLVARFAWADEADRSPFKGKLVAARGVFVDSMSQFASPPVVSLPVGSRYEAEFFRRERRGTILISDALSVHLDAIVNMVHFPSYYEVLNARTGALMGRYENYGVNDPEWYFSTNGFIYLNQSHMGLCGSRYTRKFKVSRGSFEEVRQSLYAIDEPTITTGPTALYDSPAGGTVVATLLPETPVTVMAVESTSKDPRAAALLVRTPLSLVGWHRRGGVKDEGALQIDQCN